MVRTRRPATEPMVSTSATASKYVLPPAVTMTLSVSNTSANRSTADRSCDRYAVTRVTASGEMS